MDRDDVCIMVAEVIADLADVPIEKVTPQARLDDLDMDSITKVEMIVRFRTRLGLDIPDDAIARLVSVDDVVTCLRGAAPDR